MSASCKYDVHPREAVGLEMQPAASRPKSVGPVCVTSPESPLYFLFWRLRQKLWWCISCRALLCPLSSCLGYKIYSYIEYVTRKQMDSLTFKGNRPHSDELYNWLCSIDPGCSQCPSRNSPSNMYVQGHFVSVILHGPLFCSQQTPNIDSTSCGDQTPCWIMVGGSNLPIRLMLW